MYIFHGQASLFLPHSSNLKEKRKVIQSIIARIRKRFNISIAEVNEHDLWQRSTIGFSAVAYNYSEIEIMVDAVYSTLERHINDIEILSFKYDVFRPSDL